MQNLIDTSERMAEEAREVMPYSFDECTYSKGYLRQSIWSCLGEMASASHLHPMLTEFRLQREGRMLRVLDILSLWYARPC